QLMFSKTRQVQQLAIVRVIPLASRAQQSFAHILCIYRQTRLVARVVIHHPLAPEFMQRVQVKECAVPARMRDNGSSRSRIKANPSATGKVRLHPGVSITRAHDVLRAYIVELARLKSIHHARRNSYYPQKHGHRRRKVLAMSLLALEQKL